jgi:hypothetical protein
MPKAEPCKREGCTRHGNFYPIALVPPAGGPIGQALRMVIDLPLCRDHLGQFIERQSLIDFLPEQSRAAVRIALMQRNKAMPDFTRAEWGVGRIGDEDHRCFMAVRETKR